MINSIFRDNIDWWEKDIKLKDLRNSEFIKFMKGLNLNCKAIKRLFFSMMNSILKYKIKGKIVKCIKVDNTIKYGEANVLIIKNYLEQL